MANLLKNVSARAHTHPDGERNFGVHAWARPDLPVVHILNVIR